MCIGGTIVCMRLNRSFCLLYVLLNRGTIKSTVLLIARMYVCIMNESADLVSDYHFQLLMNFTFIIIIIIFFLGCSCRVYE